MFFNEYLHFSGSICERFIMDNPIKTYDEINEEFKLYKDEMEEKLRILESIVKLGSFLNSILSKPNFLEIVNNMIISILKIDYSTIYLIEDNKYIAKVSNNEFALRVLDDKKISSYYSDTIATFNIENEYNEDNIRIHKSIMTIPLIVGERITGYIFLEHLEKHHFNFKYEEYIKKIANLIAVAIENAQLYRDLEIAAATDSLTGLYNRESFYNRVVKSCEVVKDYAIVMIDIDNFKHINDEYGHYAGDIVIIKTARIIMDNIRERDIAARYGGEEIILYIDNNQKNEEEVYYRIDELRRKIANNTIIIEDKIIEVTASFGLSFSKSEECIDDVIKEADRLLYKAKRIGKNRVVTY